ncbi:MAG: glutamate--cysteine ligase, partial [Rhodocyclaceae bacterium]
IGEICLECVRKSGLTEAFVLMTTTRGFGPAHTRDPRQCTNRFYAYGVIARLALLAAAIELEQSSDA